MARAPRNLRYLLIGLAVLAVLLVAVFIVLTRTDFGVEQAGRFAIERIRSSVHGELEVRAITSRGLLRGVTLHDVRIDDADGRPFLRADSARLAYHLRTILAGDLSFGRLVLHSPEIHIERLPGQEEWNFERVFPGDTATVRDTVERKDLVLIDDATIVNGRVYVRTPWQPEGPLEPEDTARMLLEQVPGGVARVLRFEDLDGRFSRIVWQTPDEEGRLVRIDELAGRAFIWETPLELERLEGTLTIRDSLYSFEAPRVRLPDSELAMVGRMVLHESGNVYDIEADGDDVAFADFRWLYPRLPEDGGGSLVFRIQTQGSGGTLWQARQARLRTRGTELAGSFGVVTGDTLYFTGVDLEASPLDLDLLRSLLPMELPLEGLLIGTVEVEGPISALRTRGDLRYRRMAAGRLRESEARWTGTFRGRRPFAVSDLEADVHRLDLRQLALLAPGLRVGGFVTGHVHANGSLERGLQLEGDVALDRNEHRSTVRGAGRFALGGNRSAFDLRFDAEPLALEVLAEQFPALARLTGEARGPMTVTGTLEDLEVDADIVTPAGGLRIDGRFALAGNVPRYAATGAVTDFQLDRVVAGLPETQVTGRFELSGEGAELATIDAGAALEIAAARVAGVAVHGGTVRARLSDGLATVDSLAVTTAVGDVQGIGTFGMMAERSGDLRIRLVADSLSLLEPLLLRDPLPLDSAFAEPRVGGRALAEGTLSGSIDSWVLYAAGRAEALRYDTYRAERLEAEVEWSPEDGRLALDATVDSLIAGSRRVSHARTTLIYAGGGGDVTVAARGPDAQLLDAGGAFVRTEDEVRFLTRHLALTTRNGRWLLADSVRGTVGRRGVVVEPLVLARSADNARVELRGRLPWRSEGEAGPLAAGFTGRVENLPIGEVLRVAQADTMVDGLATGSFSVSGTALAPVIEGRLMAREFRYGGARVDSVSLDLGYREQLLTGRLSGWRAGEALVRGEAQVPLDLALADSVARRLDRPMRVWVRADSVPAGLVAFMAPGFREVTGTLNGDMVVSGTPHTPLFEGELRLTDGSAFFQPSGVRYRRVEALARMTENEVLQVDARFRAGDGGGEIRGTLDLSRPGDPGFDLDLQARRLHAAQRRDVVAVADGTVHLGGRYSSPVISGNVRVLEGQLNLDEVVRQRQIVQLEPWFFEVFDTTTVAFRPEPQSPFLEYLRVTDATVAVERDFWLRGPELNVEVAGSLEVEYDRFADDLYLTGTLEARRGTYELQVVQGVTGRRFEIRDGTIEFIGTPGIDPNLAIAAQYRVRRAQGDPIDVVAQVTGSLQNPRVTLTSDTDPPVSESDLASYLIFGRSTLELTQAETDVVSSRLGNATLGQLGAGVLSLAMPSIYSGSSMLLQSGLSSIGLAVDYVAVSAPEQLGQLGDPSQALRDIARLRETQVELGFYLWQDLFLVGSLRLPSNRGGTSDSARPKFGARFEWRFLPTWLTEFYLEDRFARTPSFGLQEIEDRTVMGLSLVREWGY